MFKKQVKFILDRLYRSLKKELENLLENIMDIQYIGNRLYTKNIYRINLCINMKHFALGWACNLNDLFVRFPYEKYKSLMKKYKTKLLRRLKIKLVFRTGLEIILSDIIENNNTFKTPSLGYYGGEVHFEAIKGTEFERVRALGKFQEIDFLETLFTGYLLYLYINGKRDNFLSRRKFPIYVSKFYKNRIAELANSGKTYG